MKHAGIRPNHTSRSTSLSSAIVATLQVTHMIRSGLTLLKNKTNKLNFYVKIKSITVYIISYTGSSSAALTGLLWKQEGLFMSRFVCVKNEYRLLLRIITKLRYEAQEHVLFVTVLMTRRNFICCYINRPKVKVDVSCERLYSHVCLALPYCILYLYRGNNSLSYSLLIYLPRAVAIKH